MKIARSIAWVALAAASFAAHAEDEAGRVRALYVEASRGVFIDPRLTGAAPAAPRWADVELTNPALERRRALVLVPADMNVAVGDRVGVRLAPEQREIASLEPLPAVSRVVRVEPASRLALP